MQDDGALLQRLTAALLCWCAVLLVGCSEDNPFLPPSQPLQGHAASPGNYIIVLKVFDGPNRQASAEALRRKLTDTLNWQGVGVLHVAQESKSYVFFGPFPQHDDNLNNQLKQVHAYRDNLGQLPFRGAYIRELPRPKPVGPVNWDLARSNTYWSLQIVHYVDRSPAYPATQTMQFPRGWDRQQAAVDGCAALRAEGVEAFYYHGPTMSLVTVGAFPEEVFRYDAVRKVYTNYDRETDEYHDPRVKAYRDQERFKYNLENGLKIYKRFRLRDGRVAKLPYRSFLVRNPRFETGSD